jgi:hypothetical protein
MGKFRKNAINRVRNELGMQHSGFKLELTDLVMNGSNAEFRKNILGKLDNEQTKMSDRAGILDKGITALDDLRQALDEVAEE